MTTGMVKTTMMKTMTVLLLSDPLSLKSSEPIANSPRTEKLPELRNLGELLQTEEVFPGFGKSDYLDTELVYRLRQKESLGSVKQKIFRKLQQNESAVGFGDLVREALEGI